MWKDPRICLLLPYWRRLIQGPLAAVFVWRDPIAVSASLHERNGFSLVHGVALWERYNLSALAALEGMDVFVVEYEHVVEAPQTAYGQIAAWLDGLDQLQPWAGSWRVDQAVATIGKEFRHQVGGPALPLLESQSELLDLLRVLGGEHRPLALDHLPVASPWSTGVLESRQMVGRLAAERRLDAVLGSTSWRVTKPLRLLVERSHRR